MGRSQRLVQGLDLIWTHTVNHSTLLHLKKPSSGKTDCGFFRLGQRNKDSKEEYRLDKITRSSTREGRGKLVHKEALLR